ncbi:MAG: DUF488 domain-containing protein [Proteobacteria bacterium]|nr:DUF488 domain-containing protein [Pseudomonadota bacterium]
MLSTIGYERAELADFIATLWLSKIEVLVDIRDRAQSRRPGFSKSALSAALAEAGIEYIHVPALGDPKAGRDAARRQDYKEFRSIFGAVMKSDAAKSALLELADLAQSKSICLMCFERDQLQCHRKIVSDHISEVLNIKAQHLGVRLGVRNQTGEGRVRHSHQGAAAQV